MAIWWSDMMNGKSGIRNFNLRGLKGFYKAKGQDLKRILKRQLSVCLQLIKINNCKIWLIGYRYITGYSFRNSGIADPFCSELMSCEWPSMQRTFWDRWPGKLLRNLQCPESSRTCKNLEKFWSVSGESSCAAWRRLCKYGSSQTDLMFRIFLCLQNFIISEI